MNVTRQIQILRDLVLSKLELLEEQGRVTRCLCSDFPTTKSNAD